MSYDIVEWLSQDEINQIESSTYWNDVEIEKEKEWWIETAQDKKLLKYLKQDTNLERAFLDLVKYSESSGYGLKGVILNLAAETFWTSAIASKMSNVQKVIAIDISRHRLGIIAPIVFEQYKADSGKITRVLGSFDKIEMEANSADCIVLVEAFHHAYHPDNLMNGITRVLKPGGIVLISGENIQTNTHYFKVVMLNIIKKIICVLGIHKLLNRYLGKAIVEPQKISAHQLDEQTGDHRYILNYYARIFKKHGFALRIQRLNYRSSGGMGRDYNFLAVKRLPKA